MKKFFAFIVAVCFALSAMAETEFTFTSAADMNQTKDDITVVIAKGSGQTAPDYKASWNPEIQPSDMRLYLGNTITLTSDEPLENIQMVFAKSCASNKEYAGLSASTGTLVSGGVSESFSDWKVDSWTGNATSVVFTLTGKGQRQIQRILIDGEPIVIIPDEPDPLPTRDDLDGDFVYSEPTAISPKDTTILKAEYAFIDNNILVHCDMGSIVKGTDTTSAYFNCNANHTLTFEATKEIKGLAISGMVRKQFTAEVDHGTIEFCSPGELEEDYEGNPVVIIKDIHATSVTISCPKQVRCYAVRVYFDANPTEELDCGGGSTGGENSIHDVNESIGATKILRDGQLIILRGEKTYTASGMEIR